MKKVSIITVNYNQPQVTRELLVSITKQDYTHLEVIVVDNGSIEDPSSWILEEFEETIVIRSDRNLGFAGGNNLGIEKATGDYLFFANNDTEIPIGTISGLVETLETHPEAGAVSPVIYYFSLPNQVQFAGYTPINYLTGRNQSIGFGSYMHLQQRIVESSFVHGAAMMIPRRVIDKVGTMPENYFLYYEELDWVANIKENGFKVLVNLGCYILHKESITTGKKSPLKTYFQTRNRILFMRRNSSLWQQSIFILFFSLVSFPKNLLSYLLQAQFDHLRYLIAGTWWNLTHKPTSMDLGPFQYLTEPKLPK